MRHTRMVLAAVLLAAAAVAFGNGGPFIVKYPGGDPAAKGVLARLDPSLMPAREKRLTVVKEDLSIVLPNGDARHAAPNSSPLAAVSAVYTIENPTNERVEMDFGFPIVRGIYMSPYSMMPRPQVSVLVDQQGVATTVISNSSIYGLIRQQARETIERAIAADVKLAALVKAVPRVAPKPVEAAPPGAAPAPPHAPAPERAAPLNEASTQKARNALHEYLTSTLRWNERDAALLVEYVACDFGQMKAYPRDRWLWEIVGTEQSTKAANENLGFLGGIGEQRATQLFAVLAAKFDPKAAAAYETIFQSWGGDVRERSLDLSDGKLRPREIDLDAKDKNDSLHFLRTDPTVYARVDYLDQNSQLSDDEKTACRAVLKNLPVVFTFAPMNLLYYRVEFPPKATRVVAVSYSQYCYLDTKAPQSYQFSYVLHPASLWDSFGPINLKVSVPEGTKLRATAALKKQAAEKPPMAQQASAPAAKKEATEKTAPAAQPTAAPAAIFSADLDVPFNSSSFALAVPSRGGSSPGQDTYTATLTEAKDKTGELFIAVEKAAFDPPAKE